MSNIIAFPERRSAHRTNVQQVCLTPDWTYGLPKQRHTNSNAMARRREFKQAMRQRIRDIAASRDLSDEEIKPALTLKHLEIARFSQQHGVNLEWLLEERGSVFETDPIRIGPNMTGKELVAVLATLPQDDQEMIKAMLRQMSEKRK